MPLPPPGNSGVASYIDRVVRESVNDPRRIRCDVEQGRNLNLYLGYHYTEPAITGRRQITINRVNRNIHAKKAIIASDKPKVVMSPRETGEEPLYYINNELIASNTPQIASLLAAIPPEAWKPSQDENGNTIYPRPLLDPEVQIIQQAIQQGQMLKTQAMMLGQPAPTDIVPPELLITIDDRETADALQTVFDGIWDDSDCQMVFEENTLYNLIWGYQPTLYEFDDDNKQFKWKNPEPRQVHIDPICTDIREADWAAYDQPISVSQAKAKYPKLALEIEAQARTGALVFPGTVSYDPAYAYRAITFGREMVVLRTVWFRNEPYPMTPEEAMQAGKIQVKHPVTPESQEISNPKDEGHERIGDELRENAEQIAQLQPPAENQDQALQQQAQAQEFQNSPIFILTATGEQVSPDNPNWPTRMGIRQIRVLGSTVIEDRECEFGNIPIAWNVNSPIPNSPLGQGEPQKIEGMQYALNNLLSDIVTHYDYATFPTEVTLQSILDKLEPELRTRHGQAGKMIGVPDEYASQVQGANVANLFSVIESPRLDPDIFKVVENLIRYIDDEDNQAQVLSGNASANWSGDAINRLQTAATTVIAGKARRAEHYLKYLVELGVHSIITRMEPEDWKRYCSKPIQVLCALADKAKRLNIDIRVEIKSGSGASDENQTSELVAMKQGGFPISAKTIMDRKNLDYRSEIEQTIREQQEMAQAQQAINPATPTLPASPA